MSINDRINVTSDFADKIRDLAKSMTALGVGTYPNRGHVSVLNALADDLSAQSHGTLVPTELLEPIAAFDTTSRRASITAARDPKREVPQYVASLFANSGIAPPAENQKLAEFEVEEMLSRNRIYSMEERITKKRALERAGLY